MLVAAPIARRGGRWWGLRSRIGSLRRAGLAFAAGSLLLAMVLPPDAGVSAPAVLGWERETLLQAPEATEVVEVLAGSGEPLRAQAYSSVPAIAKEVSAGAVPAGFLLPGLARAGLADGTLRALFVVSGTRGPALPQVPTLREIGVVDLSVVDNLGLYVRSNCPVERIDALHRAAAEALLAPKVVEVMQRSSVLGRPLTRKTFADELVNGRETWKTLVQRERITIDI